MSDSHIQVKTFGDFDLYCDGKPVWFIREKSKELFAYLIDRQGNSVKRREVFAILWKDREYNRPMQKQLDVIIRSMRDTLREYDIEEIFELNHGTLRIRPEMISCDVYRFFDGDTEAVASYRGEYMRGYSWANMEESYAIWKRSGREQKS